MLAPKPWTVSSAERRLLPKKRLGLLRGKKVGTSARGKIQNKRPL